MLAYMCKYAPIEIIESFGTPVMMIEPHVTNFSQADTLMHANMCSYVKAVLEEFETHEFEGMLLTTCCDSSRRLYDVLKAKHPDKFFFCLDLPRKKSDHAFKLYESQTRALIREFEAYSGKKFSEEKLCKWCAAEIMMQKRHPKKERNNEAENLNICLTGARPGTAIKKLIQDHGCNIVLDLTCTGIERTYELDPDSVIASYSKALLSQLPCMRMADTAERTRLINEKKSSIDGVICHTIKFCDIYPYEYARLIDICDLPMVHIETDATAQGAGQILTRIEAFLESLRARKGKDSICHVCFKGDEKPRLSLDEVIGEQKKIREAFGIESKEDKKMYVMGIDSGSTSTNAVIMNDKKEIIAFDVVRTGAKSGESAEKILSNILEKSGLKREDISQIISTGYGRVSIPFADKNVTEISCHGRGAHFLNPDVRTILDIGGQDSKAIRLDESGNVVDFVMNDKCAAGTGRFLEMMARTLEVSIEELGPISLEYKENIQISSMCSVFAESEVISLIAQNKEKADIARGIHKAISLKAMSLMKRVGLEKGYMMTGGVAKNPGVVKVLEEQLGDKLYIYEEPEIVGAIGAALYAFD